MDRARHRNLCGRARSGISPSCLIARLVIALLVLACVLTIGPDAGALSIERDSDERKDIHRLYELASEGIDYDAAVEGIIAYTQRSNISIGDRRYAFSKLGDLAAPELKNYLLSVATREIEIDDGDELSHYAHQAYWATLLAEAKTEAEEDRILLAGLKATIVIPQEGPNEPIATTVRSWAAEHLCTRGKLEYFDEIRSAINSHDSGNNNQQQIELCRRKLELLNKFDSRLETMEYILENTDLTTDQILQTNTAQDMYDDLFDVHSDDFDVIALEEISRIYAEVDNSENQRLRSWALTILWKMESEDADEILFNHVMRSLEDAEKDIYTRTLVTAVTYLHLRNWTLENFVDHGIDRNNIALRDALYFAGVKNLE